MAKRYKDLSIEQMKKSEVTALAKSIRQMIIAGATFSSLVDMYGLSTNSITEVLSTSYTSFRKLLNKAYLNPTYESYLTDDFDITFLRLDKIPIVYPATIFEDVMILSCKVLKKGDKVIYQEEDLNQNYISFKNLWCLIAKPDYTSKYGVKIAIYKPTKNGNMTLYNVSNITAIDTFVAIAKAHFYGIGLEQTLLKSPC